MAGNREISTDRISNLRAHERTFAGFVKFLAWLFGLSALAVIIAALSNV